MKGDFSRNTFNPQNFFTRVLMQQGRVQVDADWNEQASILLHYIQTLASDIIGPHGGPVGSFEISEVTVNNFKIAAGHYYVNGRLCQNLETRMYADLPTGLRPDTLNFENEKRYVVYLDVWERHITDITNGNIREKALNGPDTATRAQLVWQIRTATTDQQNPTSFNLTDFLDSLKQKPGSGQLKAYVNPDSYDADTCNISPESRFRGPENQLYRVEIHDEKDPDDDNSKATWKWSRDNGAVVFPIRTMPANGETITVEHLGRDERFGLKAGDWVEVVDDIYELHGRSEALLQVEEIRANDLQVILKGELPPDGIGTDRDKHPFLRRWDQKQKKNVNVTESGVIAVPDSGAVELEDGIMVEFSDGDFRTGDYWLIPARVATGNVEWRLDSGNNPMFISPHGAEHVYAPLSHIAVDNSGAVTNTNLRRQIGTIAE